jgi:hypothetical protein
LQLELLHVLHLWVVLSLISFLQHIEQVLAMLLREYGILISLGPSSFQANGDVCVVVDAWLGSDHESLWEIGPFPPLAIGVIFVRTQHDLKRTDIVTSYNVRRNDPLEH